MQALLELDVDLADEFDAAGRAAVGASPNGAGLPVMTLEADPGRLALEQWLEAAWPGPGLIVVDGVVATTVLTANRTSAELLGEGDLIHMWPDGDAELVSEVGWRALTPTRFALLDREFTQRAAGWPLITGALLRRSGTRIRRLNRQRAIASQPRLDARLVLLMWHLAAKWGKVEPGGVGLTLPLTHELLSWLIGAERPSVSHALARLARSGTLTRKGDKWRLQGSVEEHLKEIDQAPSYSLAGSLRAFAPLGT